MLTLTLALAGVALVAAPAGVTVKLATLAPRNSLWFGALTDMGGTWAKVTEGRVTLNVFPDGAQGDEPTVIKMMRPDVDSMNAAFLTAPGLATIDDGFNVFGIPFFFTSNEEAHAVRKALTPMLAKRLEAKGFHLLNWGDGGWVQVFSKNPVRSLDDLKHTKLFTSKGDDQMAGWYTSNGFTPVPTKSTEIVANMGTGLINATPIPAYPASVIQLYRKADYMLDVSVAPLYGAIVVADRVWKGISEADRTKMAEAAATMEQHLDASVPGQDQKAVADMKLRSPKFTVIRLDDKALAAFRAEAEKMAASMRGTIVPKDVYEEALLERDAFRKTKGK
jgi:TRAP-type C4-dicarboxylate transport system substrate-binding protein